MIKNIPLTDERKEKINSYLRNPVDFDNVFLFAFVAADNEMDDYGERFSLKSLKSIARLIVGKSGYIANSSGVNNIGRIIEADTHINLHRKTKEDSSYVYVEAIAFIIKNDKTSEVCEQIQNGVLTEISLGAACTTKTKTKSGYVIRDVDDVYEWSIQPPKPCNTIKFILDGCDISFVAEAPRDMTVEQLLKQATRIQPLYCACGVRLCNDEFEIAELPEIIFDYEDVQKTNEDIPCRIAEEE